MGWINDKSRGTDKVNSLAKFKTSMLKSSLCDYNNAYILLSATKNTVAEKT